MTFFEYETNSANVWTFSRDKVFPVKGGMCKIWKDTSSPINILSEVIKEKNRITILDCNKRQQNNNLQDEIWLLMWFTPFTGNKCKLYLVWIYINISNIWWKTVMEMELLLYCILIKTHNDIFSVFYCKGSTGTTFLLQTNYLSVKLVLISVSTWEFHHLHGLSIKWSDHSLCGHPPSI